MFFYSICKIKVEGGGGESSRRRREKMEEVEGKIGSGGGREFWKGGKGRDRLRRGGFSFRYTFLPVPDTLVSFPFFFSWLLC